MPGSVRKFINLLLCCFLPNSFVLTAGETDTLSWTPEYSLKFRSISGLTLSGDGKLAAYVVSTPLTDGEKSEYLRHIWVSDATPGSGRQYTRGENSATSPAFSPDGKWLAFLTARSGKTQIWMMQVDGGEAFQISDEETAVSGMQWSPDGKSIAFLMRDAETEDEKQRKKEKRDAFVVDSNFKYAHLYVIPVEHNPSGEKAKSQRLTRGNFHISSFDWHPNSSGIVFSHQADPTINTGFSERNISMVAADSGTVKPLVTWPGSDRSPMFSPDGKHIAFVSHGGKPQAIGLSDLYVVSVHGGTPSKAIETPNRNAGLVGWNATGKALLAVDSERTTRHLYEVPLQGGKAKRISPQKGVLGSVASSADRRHHAWTWEDLTTAPEVYHKAAGAEKPVRISAVNDKVALPEMGRAEILRWKSEDGLEIEGILTYPIGYSGGKVPLVLNVHGGPAGVYSQRFSGRASIYLIQYFAQNGFAVLQPNPRGSTGYGKDFRYANVRDWGYGDLNDLLAGVDKTIDMGVAHPDSLCLMGWSYGGYMTAFAVTRTQRFKAASMGAGLSNLISMMHTNDIPNYLAAHMGAEVWEDYDVYEKHSAIYGLNNVITPVQVLHGENDLRVPLGQGQEFYNALKRKGISTELVVYPRTPHGPREPKLLIDVSPRILDWFEKHLGRNLAKPEPPPGE